MCTTSASTSATATATATATVMVKAGLVGASTITGLAGPSKGAAKLRDRGNRIEAR